MRKHGSVIIFILVLAVLFLLIFVLSMPVPYIHKTPHDKGKIHILQTAIVLYESKYSDLPTESNFRDVLLTNKLVQNEKAFYSDDTDILIRYFRQGTNFVLVSPGKNKKYDTPEGYENIKAFEKETDDIIDPD